MGVSRILSAKDVNKKKAPRQKVLSIDREGAWGRVEYLHRLECGHIEKRKRPAKTDVMACSWCVVAEEKGVQLQSLAVAPQAYESDDDLLDVLGGSLAASEKAVAKLRADIASRLKVPPDYVDIVTLDDEGMLSVSYAVVFIPAGDIPALLAEPSDDQT